MNPIDVLYVASFWASAASALLCIAAAIHLRCVRVHAAAGDGVAAQSAVLPALEPVVHTAALMFAVRWSVLDPGSYPLPPAWYNNSQYIGVAVDFSACLRYFLYWFTFEAVSIGVTLLFTAEWLSTSVIRRCLAGGVAAGAVLAGITTFGFNHQELGMDVAWQRGCDYAFLVLPCCFYMCLITGLVKCRPTIMPFAVYSVFWRLVLFFAILGAEVIAWPGVIIHIALVISFPPMVYASLAMDSRYWRDLPHHAQRKASRARTASHHSGSHGSFGLSEPLVNGPAADGHALAARRRSRASTASDGSSGPKSGRPAVGGPLPQRQLPVELQALRDACGGAVIDFGFLAVGRKVLGRGATCVVYAGKLKGEPVAVKSFSPSKVSRLDVATICRETSICSYLQHPRIVKYHGICFAPPRVRLVFELCDLGSLYQAIPARWPGWSVDQRLSLALDAADAVAYLHSFDPPIIHHDIKSGNFMVKDDAASGRLCMKLCDFGESRIFAAAQDSGFDADLGLLSCVLAGTPAWMAPEIINGEPESQAVDVYSLGVVMWELVTGRRPFDGVSDLGIARRVGEEDERPPLENDGAACRSRVPPAVLALIRRCWARAPADRPSAADAAQTLRGVVSASISASARSVVVVGAGVGAGVGGVA